MALRRVSELGLLSRVGDVGREMLLLLVIMEEEGLLILRSLDGREGAGVRRSEPTRSTAATS